MGADPISSADRALGSSAAAGRSESVLFFSTTSGERLGERSLTKQMAQAPILLLGEVHDDALHHRVRARLMLDWVKHVPDRPAVIVFEHLDREHDQALSLAQRQPAAGGKVEPGLAELLAAARFDRESWGWPAHLPLFEAAQASGARWIAANFSRASAQRLSRDPSLAVDPALQAMVESARWSPEAQQALAQALVRGHCQQSMPAASLERILRIQRLRDAALALPLLDASERRSVLLAGNGHVRRDHGVPLYLGAYEREALVIGFEQVAETEIKVSARDHSKEGSELARVVGTTRAGELGNAYDVVALTMVPSSKDHCAEIEALRKTSTGPPAGPGAGTGAGTGADTATVNPAAPTQTPSR